MIDIHSHIISGVDDGPSTIEQSVAMAYQAQKAGIKTIIATPHAHESLFDSERLSDNYQELLYRIRDYDIVLKLGYEVFINPSMPGMEKKNIGLTMDDTRYLLFELPFNTLPGEGLGAIQSLRQKDIVPILAHPERNRNFIRNFNELTGYVNAGCLLQIDAASVLGIYGRDVREFAKKLIRWNRVDFVASNAHCAQDYVNWYMKAWSEVSKWSGEASANRLFQSNAENLLHREEKMHAV